MVLVLCLIKVVGVFERVRYRNIRGEEGGYWELLVTRQKTVMIPPVSLPYYVIP